MDKLILILFYLVLFFMGASLGSFALVVVRRGHNNDWKSWLTGHSYCENCKKTLVWWELIPTISFLALGGKCSKCRTKIDPSHFICETFTGLMFCALFVLYQFDVFTLPQFVFALIVNLLFISLSASDFLYREINSVFVYVLGAIGCAYQAIFEQNYIVIPIVAVLFVLVGILGAKDNFILIGCGDLDVGVAIYALLGSVFGMIDVVFYSAAVGIILFACLYRKSEKAIPFVPCLYVGYFLASLDISISQWLFDLCQRLF